MRVQQIYVNLAVQDLKKSMDFFSALGFEFNMQFTNDQGACLVLADNICAMLLQKTFFKTFIPDREITDPKKAVEALNCLSVATRKDVDDLIQKAVAAGGKVYHEPQDHGFMYGQAFEDLDGHLWEVMSYEPKK